MVAQMEHSMVDNSAEYLVVRSAEWSVARMVEQMAQQMAAKKGTL